MFVSLNDRPQVGQGLKAARNQAIAGRVNLALRRAWFDDTGEGGMPSPGDDETFKLEDLPPAVQKHIKELRSEAASRRLELKKAREEETLRQQASLAEQGKWEELAKKSMQELEGLKPKAHALDQYQQHVLATLQKRIDALPEAYRGAVPDFDDPLKKLAWLDANAGLLTTPRPPDLDAGNRGVGGGSPAQLTADQLAAAKALRVSPEAYAKRLSEMNAQKK